ncbi:MAG: hypothetical protein ACTS6J_04575 [Burkholderiales bacterium]
MHTTHIRSDIFSRVNDLHLSENERLRINAYIQDGEFIAEYLSRALAGIRSGVALAGHAAGSLAQGVKAAFARPARH